MDLLGGIGPWHVRALCENSWEGGREFTPGMVGDMTLDTVYMLLADKNNLRKSGKRRTATVQTVMADAEGFVHGVARDGTKIKGKVRGKSVARDLMEKAEARRLEEEKQKGGRRKRKGR